MKAKEKATIDGLAKKAFEAAIASIPDDSPSFGREYRLAAQARGRAPNGRRTTPTGRRRLAGDPFAFVACALALILVIPTARGMARTALADTAAEACESGRLSVDAELMSTVFARGGEYLLHPRENKH